MPPPLDSLPIVLYLHTRVPEDVHLSMDNPARSIVKQLDSLDAAGCPGILHVVPCCVLQGAEPSGVRSPMVHLHVDVSVVVGVPCCGQRF